MARKKENVLSTIKSLHKIKPSHADARGGIFDLLDADRIRHAGLLISKPKSLRGNHFHKKATQYTYVIEGKINIYLREAWNANGAVKKIVMSEGDMIRLPPYIIHTIEAKKL